jgi:DNA-binding response OmpR family regulator
MATRVLLVDDEPVLTDSLRPLLERSGFEVAIAASGEEALRQMAHFGPDLVVLDILMPGMDGREVLRRLRQAGNRTPVVMLTKVGDAAERAMTLDEGADDYLNKPFQAQELIARVNAVLRRGPVRPTLDTAPKLACGPLLLDRSTHCVYVDGEEVSLTPKAFALLEHLMAHPGQLFGREKLLDVLWGWEYPGGTRVVDVRVAELRKVLGDEREQPRFILTVPGQGYQFIGRVEALPG